MGFQLSTGCGPHSLRRMSGALTTWPAPYRIGIDIAAIAETKGDKPGAWLIAQKRVEVLRHDWEMVYGWNFARLADGSCRTEGGDNFLHVAYPL